MVKPSVSWRSHVLVTGSAKSTSSSGAADANTSSNATLGLVHLLVDELTADAVLRGQVADSRRSRQRQNGHLLSVYFEQSCCRTSGWIHGWRWFK